MRITLVPLVLALFISACSKSPDSTGTPAPARSENVSEAATPDSAASAEAAEPEYSMDIWSAIPQLESALSNTQIDPAADWSVDKMWGNLTVSCGDSLTADAAELAFKCWCEPICAMTINERDKVLATIREVVAESMTSGTFVQREVPQFGSLITLEISANNFGSDATTFVRIAFSGK